MHRMRQLVRLTPFVGRFVHARPSIARLDTLRSAGQERIVKAQWAEWHARIERIKSNPLTAAAKAEVANAAPK
jgi:hypothetical protein